MKVPPSACPNCNQVNNGATYLEDESIGPKAGDLSLCLNCGEILMFNADLTTRAVALDDLIGLPSEIQAQLTRMQQAIRRLPSRA